MTPFFPFMTIPALPTQFDRRTRLQDIEARMSSFLNEKQMSDSACQDMLDGIKASKANVQQEIAASR